MPDDRHAPDHPPRPPAQADSPRTEETGGTPRRNAHPENDRGGVPVSGDEPRVEDLGARSFAGETMAADQRRQPGERAAGLGAGGSDTRDAVHPAQSEGEVPEDDMD